MGSLAIIEGESRYFWKHGIVTRRFDSYVDSASGKLETFERSLRVSYTFRKLRVPPICNCDYPMFCDTQANRRPVPLSKEIREEKMFLPRSSVDAEDLEAKYVQGVYDEIAETFSGTRHSMWPRVKQFLDEIPSGSILLDLGCGNGKYLFGHPSVFKLGLDNSSGLIDICSDRGFQVMTSDCLNTPLRNSCCDYVISIAVIHHLSTLDRRKAVIEEFLRLLRKGGRALIYVWAMEQKMNDKKSNYISSKRSDNEIDFQLKSINLVESSKIGPENEMKDNTIEYHVNRTPFQQQDLFVPFARRKKNTKSDSNQTPVEKSERKDETFYRFYHLFKQGELDELCLSCSSDERKVEVVDSYYDDGNWCLVFQKD